MEQSGFPPIQTVLPAGDPMKPVVRAIEVSHRRANMSFDLILDLAAVVLHFYE